MKAKRQISPAVITGPLLLGILALLGTIGLVGCGGQEAPLTDNGPNAGLSNEELVAKAISNTKAAASYHVDFTADLRVPDLSLRESLSMTTDLGLRTKEGRFKVAYRREGPPDVLDTFLSYGTQMTAATEVLSTADGWYESYDVGKTWSKPADFTPAFVSTLFLCPLGSSMWLMCPPEGENLLENQTFKDGSPRLEEVDGAVLRHVVAEIEPLSNGEQPPGQLYAWLAAARSVELWVSTDITPTIKQMKIRSANNAGSGAGSDPGSDPGSDAGGKTENDAVNDIVSGRSGQIYSLAFSPDGKLLAVAHGDNTDPTVRLWDLAQPGSSPRKFTNAEGGFKSVAFSPDGKLLAASGIASGRPHVYVWDLSKSNTEPVILEAPPVMLPAATLPRYLSSVAYRPDGTILVAGGHGGVVLWEAPFGTKPPVTTSSQEFVATDLGSVVFSPDSNTLYAGDFSHGVFVLDVRRPNDDPAVLPVDRLMGLAISPDGHLLAANGYSTLKVWDLTQSPPSPRDLPVSAGQGTRLAISADSRYLAVGTDGISSGGGVLRLWDLKHMGTASGNSTVPHTPAVEVQLSEPFYSIAFSPDGKTLALGGSGKGEGTVHLWSMEELLKSGTAALPTPSGVRDTGTKVGDSSFTLIWKVSHFNEDLGEVILPSPETIREP